MCLVQEAADIRRIKWSQAWMPRYFYQHVYMPMLYCVVSDSLSLSLSDCVCVCVCVLAVGGEDKASRLLHHLQTPEL